MTTKTIVQELAHWILDFDPSIISEEITHLAKLSLLDALGCAYAAHSENAVKDTLAGLGQLGGTAQCSVIGSTHRTSVANAALANGTLIRALDLNDHMALDPADGKKLGGHPSDSIGVALAVAERENSSGRDLLASLVVGYELFGRLQRLLTRDRPWDHVTALGLVAPAVAGRLLHLDPERLAHALGLGAAHAATPGVVRRGRLSAAKFLAGPMVAYHGLLSALLAAHGVTGPLGVFEDERGLAAAILPGEDLTTLTRAVHPPFMLQGVTIKAYPCMDTCQAAVSAVLEVRDSLAVPVNEIERIELSMMDHPVVRDQARDPERRHPKTRETADHSFYFLAAVALLDGELSPRQFENERWVDSEVCHLMEKIHIDTDGSWNQRAPDGFPCGVRVIARGRECGRAEIAYAPGYPRNRMNAAAVIAKFNSCTQDMLSERQRANIAARVMGLDSRPSVKGLMSLLRCR